MEVYPQPDIQSLFRRITDAVQPFISQSEFESYQQAVGYLFSNTKPTAVSERIASQSIDQISKLFPGSKNWATEWILQIMLSTRLQVQSTKRLSIRTSSPPAVDQDLQISTAAQYLRAVAIWNTHLRDGAEYTPAQKLLKHQLDSFTSFRLPSETVDTLKHASRHSGCYSVVWYYGTGFKVELADETGVFSVAAIIAQLVDIKSSKIEVSAGPQVAAYSWRLDRPSWHKAYNQLRSVPGNQRPFDILTNAVISVALDENIPPVVDSDFLNDVREGVTSPNRYADQVLSLVVYPDGQPGLTAEHAPMDFASFIELASILHKIFANDKYEVITPESQPVLSPLIFHHPSTPLPDLPPKYIEPVTRRTKSFILPSIPPLKRRATDPLVNLSFQAALFKSKHGLTAPMFQPVQQIFINGRCDTMWPITVQSASFVQLLTGDAPLETLTQALRLTLEKRAEIVQVARSGLAPDMFRRPLIAEIQNATVDEALEEETRKQLQTILKTLNVMNSVSSASSAAAAAQASCIHFTGVTLPLRAAGEAPSMAGEIVAALSNIYLPNHLVVFYLGRPDGTISVMINAAGSFDNVLDEVVREMQIWYPKVVQVYDAL